MGNYKYYEVVFFWLWVVVAMIGCIGLLVEKIMMMIDSKKATEHFKKLLESGFYKSRREEAREITIMHDDTQAVKDFCDAEMLEKMLNE